jgi:hypothetical protein
MIYIIGRRLMPLGIEKPYFFIGKRDGLILV